MEDFLLSYNRKWPDLTRVLGVQNAPWNTDKLKEDIKHSLNDGLSVEQSEKLAEIVKKFYGIERLWTFLKSLA